MVRSRTLSADSSPCSRLSWSCSFIFVDGSCASRSSIRLLTSRSRSIVASMSYQLSAISYWLTAISSRPVFDLAVLPSRRLRPIANSPLRGEPFAPEGALYHSRVQNLRDCPSLCKYLMHIRLSRERPAYLTCPCTHRRSIGNYEGRNTNGQDGPDHRAPGRAGTPVGTALAIGRIRTRSRRGCCNDGGAVRGAEHRCPSTRSRHPGRVARRLAGTSTATGGGGRADRAAG